PVPIEVRGGEDGRFDRGDAIVFYGRRSGTSHTRHRSYVLTMTAKPRHAQRTLTAESRDTVDEGWREVTVEEDLLFVPLATVRQDVIRSKDPHEHWYWRRLLAPENDPDDKASDASMATFLVDLDPEPRR